MTENDKKRFDSFFRTDRYFKNVSEADMMRNACEMDKLHEYLQGSFTDDDERLRTLKYMHFAYALGRYGKGAT